MSKDIEIQEKTTNEPSYFEERIFNKLGVTQELNKIILEDPSNDGRKITFDIFSEDKNGNIRILVYNLQKQVIVRDRHQYEPKTDHRTYKNQQDYFYITRLKEPKEFTDKEGHTSKKKYDIPFGAGTYPFFPPHLIHKYQNAIEIKTLVLTEGYFKAFKACIEGIDTVGLSSITHYRNKDTKQMYEDVLRLINRCQVSNVIILFDSDCRDISESAIKKEKDLYLRPASFLNSAEQIRELLKDTACDIYFSHVDDGKNKGLDDLLIDRNEITGEISEELLSLSRQKLKYFYRTKITRDTKKLYTYFKVNNIANFYEFHEDIIDGKNFVFKGTNYQVTGEGKIEVRIPADVKYYFRVGTTYYKHVSVPNKYQQIEKQFHKWEKGAIIDDFSKSFLKHIPKYEAFCNVPDHKNYANVIHNCFNTYHEFAYDPEPGNCEITKNFLKHIFGYQIEFGLDYIQLLYHTPTQQLPILSFVSEEQETGKSTFNKWLKAIFGQNATFLGNQDINNDFNFVYSSKLLIIIEESIIDKQPVIEKIKGLSTTDKITVNRKGKDHIEMDFFGKFIFNSNNEKNSILIDKDDRRFWVIKVGKPERRDPDLLEKLIDEIPAFLDFLNHRDLSTKKSTRMWFDPDNLITDAKRKMQMGSQSSIIKDIRLNVKEAFLIEPPELAPYVGFKDKYQGMDVPTFYCSNKGVQEHWLKKNNHKDHYIFDILENELRLKKESKAKRDEYLIVSSINPLNDEEIIPEWKKGNVGKPSFIFQAPDFLTDVEMGEVKK